MKSVVGGEYVIGEEGLLPSVVGSQRACFNVSLEPCGFIRASFLSDLGCERSCDGPEFETEFASLTSPSNTDGSKDWRLGGI